MHVPKPPVSYTDEAVDTLVHDSSALDPQHAVLRHCRVSCSPPTPPSAPYGAPRLHLPPTTHWSPPTVDQYRRDLDVRLMGTEREVGDVRGLLADVAAQRDGLRAELAEGGSACRLPCRRGHLHRTHGGCGFDGRTTSRILLRYRQDPKGTTMPV